jgi:hypothetical protein
MNRHILFDLLPMIFALRFSRPIHSSRAKERAANFVWTGRLERMMVRKIHAREQNADTFRRSETHYLCGTSSSTVESSSAERSDVPLLTPPALVVEGMGMGKESSRLELPRP